MMSQGQVLLLFNCCTGGYTVTCDYRRIYMLAQQHSLPPEREGFIHARAHPRTAAAAAAAAAAAPAAGAGAGAQHITVVRSEEMYIVSLLQCYHNYIIVVNKEYGCL